jgi:hypothetical protein
VIVAIHGSAEPGDSVADLERRISDLKARLPKHSVPPAMLIELETLEEALETARRQAGEEQAPCG